MTTTSLKLPEDLKQRTIAAANELGLTPHAFMVEAIRKAAVAAENRAQFVAQAKAAEQEMLETGCGYDADDVRAYMRDRIAGGTMPHPEAKPWRS